MTPDQRTKSVEADSRNPIDASQETEPINSSNRDHPTSNVQRSRPNNSWPLRIVVFFFVMGVLFYLSILWWGGGSQDKQKALTHKVTRGDLIVTVLEQGTVESSNNLEIKCKVRGNSVVTNVIQSGTHVEPGDELVRHDTKRIEDEFVQLNQSTVKVTNSKTSTTTSSNRLHTGIKNCDLVDCYVFGNRTRYRFDLWPLSGTKSRDDGPDRSAATRVTSGRGNGEKIRAEQRCDSPWRIIQLKAILRA